MSICPCCHQDHERTLSYAPALQTKPSCFPPYAREGGETVRVYTKAELLVIARRETRGCGPQHCDCASPAEWIEENL